MTESTMEGIIVPLYQRFVVYPGGAGVEEGASVEEVSLVYPGTLVYPSTLFYPGQGR